MMEVEVDLSARGLVRGEDGRVRPVWASLDELQREYYDFEWGAPVRSEQGIYERLCLEGFQSGLSWATVLRKRPAFREVFAGFDPDAVAAFDEEVVEALMADARIIRNRRKITAAINNAQATVALRGDGGLAELVWGFVPAEHARPESAKSVQSTSPESVAMAKALKTAGFRFVGPTTCYALMQALGMVDDRIVGASPLIRG
ncbi:DNA-3-methyladenine glycosylase I [Corynebacterium vitaeruminis]|uniref:DNA-3-methyladenine glycosylase I n=1 Tax=Corynebacterium vitaeruminis TaxID=38305 RepID=UPI00046C9A71